MCCLTLLPKLLASSYVVMLGWGEKAAFLCHSRAFAFHKRAYEPVVTASMPQGSLAGRTEDHRLAASLQVEQAVACAVVCLRWHVGVVEDARHHLREFPGRLSGTLYVLAGAQSPVLARVACKVLLHDGVLAFGMVSWVRCDEFPVHVDFHERACVGHVGLFGDMLVRHAVVVLVASEVYAAVGGHLEARVGDYLKVRCRQRSQVGAVDGKEALLAGVRVLLHALLVVLAHLVRGCGIQLVDGIEGLVAELREDAHVYEPDIALHVGLVPGADGACRHHDRSIVVGHVLKHPVERRLVPVGLDDRRLEVVGNEHSRHAPKVFQALCDGVHKVLRAL